MCGEHTVVVVLWLPSHYPSGCCTLVVIEEKLPDMIVKSFSYTAIHLKAAYKYLIQSFICDAMPNCNASFFMWVLEDEVKLNINFTSQTTSKLQVYLINIKQNH